MPSYKLTYFNIKGRGEIPRLLFAAAGIKFEDDRVEQAEWGPEYKKKLPLGFLPVLTVDGKQLSQSMTIARFLAATFGLDGKTNWDKAVVNEILDTIVDLKDEIYKTFFEKDEAKKAEIEKTLKEEKIPKLLNYLEKQLGSSKSGFIVGDSLTVADLAVMDIVQLMFFGSVDFLEKPECKKLKCNYEKVSSLPRIKEWCAKRPQTPY